MPWSTASVPSRIVPDLIARRNQRSLAQSKQLLLVFTALATMPNRYGSLRRRDSGRNGGRGYDVDGLARRLAAAMPLDGQRGYEEPPRRRESLRRPEPARYEAAPRDYARELAAQMPLDGFPAPYRENFYSTYANPIRQMGLLGPTVREALPRDEPAAKTRQERNANGSVQEVYSLVKRIGEGGQGQ